MRCFRLEEEMNFDQDWMHWALQIEEDLNTDISAGLDIGENLEEYLTELAEHQKYSMASGRALFR